MPNDELLTELQSQLERVIQIKDRLDTKANNMITISGIVATVFMGFGTFLLSNVDLTKHLCIAILAGLSLFAEIILTVFTIKYSLESYKLRNYYLPLGYQAFFDENTDEINYDVIKQFNESSKEDFDQHFIDEYLRSIKSYQVQNHDQTVGINKAQRTMIGTIVAIPVFAFFIVLLKFLS